MPPARPDPFVLLGTAADPAAADLCASLLRSAGIDSRLRGESLGPYRLTIGDMALTQVWVPLSRLEDARSLVFESEVPGLEPPPTAGPPRPASGRGPSWSPLALAAGAALLALTLWLVLARLF